MGRHYGQVTLAERHELFRLHKAGMAITAIARRLGRHRSTIHRELRRNRRSGGAYLPDTAQRFAWARLPKRARRSAAFDNGGEWARHERLRGELAMRTYFFCDPHSPWQRGGIENANGVLRRDVPRHATLGHYTDADLDAVLWAFNTRPRKCLGFRTPLEAFAQHLGVALET